MPWNKDYLAHSPPRYLTKIVCVVILVQQEKNSSDQVVAEHNHSHEYEEMLLIFIVLVCVLLVCAAFVIYLLCNLKNVAEKEILNHSSHGESASHISFVSEHEKETKRISQFVTVTYDSILEKKQKVFTNLFKDYFLVFLRHFP